MSNQMQRLSQQLDRLCKRCDKVWIILKVIGHGERIVVDHVRRQGGPCVVETKHFPCSFVLGLQPFTQSLNTSRSIRSIAENSLPREKGVHGATAEGVMSMVRCVERCRGSTEAVLQVINF